MLLIYNMCNTHMWHTDCLRPHTSLLFTANYQSRKLKKNLPGIYQEVRMFLPTLELGMEENRGIEIVTSFQ